MGKGGDKFGKRDETQWPRRDLCGVPDEVFYVVGGSEKADTSREGRKICDCVCGKGCAKALDSRWLITSAIFVIERYIVDVIALIAFITIWKSHSFATHRVWLVYRRRTYWRSE